MAQSLTIPVLRPASVWGGIAIGSWLIAPLASFSMVNIDRSWQDQLWYWTSVLSCCPFISVLGARRPTSYVWTWFIIFPLIAVLGWPAVTVLFRYPDVTPLKMQLPAFLGFGLVLVMGAGNYIGSRFSLSAFLTAGAVLISLAPLSTTFQGEPQVSTLWRAFAAILCGLGLLHGLRQSQRPTTADSGYDKLWFDFCDAFGLVWSIRIQDRINQTAESERWVVRLGTTGFLWDQDALLLERDRTETRLKQTLHWLLRRFVEPEWVESRIVDIDADESQ